MSEEQHPTRFTDGYGSELLRQSEHVWTVNVTQIRRLVSRAEELESQNAAHVKALADFAREKERIEGELAKREAVVEAADVYARAASITRSYPENGGIGDWFKAKEDVEVAWHKLIDALARGRGEKE
jgi:hypothetical protein